MLCDQASRGGPEWIHARVREDDVITGRGPRNDFELVRAERYIFIAGGIGITPILAMVRAASKRSLPWTLVYGRRSRASMAFLEELAHVPNGRLRVIPEEEHGLLDLERFFGQPNDGTVVYCCGPGPLLDAVEQHCQRWPKGVLHVERFAPSKNKEVPIDGEFDIELPSTGSRLHVPAFSSMLDFLEENGYDVTNSCRAGILRYLPAGGGGRHPRQSGPCPHRRREGIEPGDSAVCVSCEDTASGSRPLIRVVSTTQATR